MLGVKTFYQGEEKMRKIKKLISVLLAVLLMAALVACNGGGKTDGETYTITFHSNGGSDVPPVTYNAKEGVEYLPEPEKAGYMFGGWYNNPALGGDAYWDIAPGRTGDLDLYAAWSDATYQISYRNCTASAGVTLPSNAPKSYKTTSADTLLPVPEKNGYAFAGWYDNAALTGAAVTVIPSGSSGDKEFWPKWDIVSYAVHFVLNGGSDIADIPYTIETDTFALPLAERAYFTFAGWFAASDLGGTAVGQVTKGSTGNKTFYAAWTADVFGITYYHNGGAFPQGVEYPQTYTAEGNVSLVSSQKASSSFVGWFDNEELTGDAITVIAPGRSGNLDLYAKWYTVSHTITYNTDGGALPAGYPQGFNEDEAVTLPVPTKTGHNFVDWFDNAGLSGSAVTTIPAGTTASQEFWAKWQVATYRVTFVLSGGTGADDFSYTYGDAAVTLPTTAHRTGYKFLAWYQTPGYTDTPVTTLPQGSYGDKTYYAKWEANVYTLRYELLGGSLGAQPAVVQFTPDAAVPLPATDPTRTGHTFGGWYDNANLTIVSQGVPAGTTNNISIYAKWTANVYRLTYNLDGGTLPPNAITSYTYQSAITDPNEKVSTITILPIPTKSGLAFGGWYETPSPVAATEGKLGMIRAGVIGDKTLYALWLAPVAQSTQIMEAENTQLIGRTGPGLSGSSADSGRIQADWGQASGGKVVGWTYAAGIYIDYEFSLDRAVTNATVTIGLGCELSSVTSFNPENLRVYVNGVVNDNWSPIVAQDGSEAWFGSTDISNVTLLAGYNIITFEVLENDMLPGADAAGPLFDYITVKAAAAIGWEPIQY
jgi:uncharacterized repeat protein (TIGR02543 family)